MNSGFKAAAAAAASNANEMRHGARLTILAIEADSISLVLLQDKIGGASMFSLSMNSRYKNFATGSFDLIYKQLDVFSHIPWISQS